MQKLTTEVLVIGGGATGTGVVRDLALRGFKAILVEKGDLTHGTTGRYHGLLHSGGRYAVKDPTAARECIDENRILRRIMPHCIEDTGGFFVLTPWDDPAYADQFVAACQNATIEVEELSIAQMLKEEPLLNPAIQRCFRVPDGSADSFLGADVNAESARQHGSKILTYHKLLGLVKSGDKVTGARCRDLVSNEEVLISADLVVNAAGAWAGQVTGTVGIPVKVIPGKGTMLAINHRILNTVVNRCKLPSDGDIIVPAHTVAVVGTTDVKVEDPDRFAIEPWEVQLMLDEGDKLVPGLSSMRMLRAWAGVRPLYQETAAGGNRDVTRAFVLLDHETRDGVGGLLTITSGKWTTYRKMAEVTVDLVCQKLGVERICRTADEVLPGAGAHAGHHYLGLPLAEVERTRSYGRLVCECELATYEDIERAIVHNQAKTIDDVRRDARLGMGPCQGGFCTLRVAGILHTLRRPAVHETNVALRDFLQERWKGLLPVLWGQQLRQERLDELIYLNVLGADMLPGPQASRLAPVNYEPGSPAPVVEKTAWAAQSPTVPLQAGTSSGYQDVVIVGAGLAGLTTAWQATARGKRVHLIAKGMGATHWASGCIDVLGYYPPGGNSPLFSPIEGLERLIADHPRHPYALTGLESLEEALTEFQELCEQANYPFEGTLEHNWLLPTALGTARPTCLAPLTMTAGNLRSSESMLIVGFKQYGDFYPHLVAANLAERDIPAEALVLDLPVLADRRFTTSRTLAVLFDLPERRAEVAAAIKPHLGQARRVGLPAVLGLKQPLDALRDLEQRLGLPVFEIPILPASIAGMRLHNLLAAVIARQGGRVFDGMQAVGGETADGKAQVIWTEAAARRKPHRAEKFVLATGGLLGGGMFAAHTGEVREVILDLPVGAPPGRSEWFRPEFLDPAGHPIFQAGVEVDPHLRPLGPDGQPLYKNVYAAGGLLSHSDSLREHSLEGIALATGYLLGRSLL